MDIISTIKLIIMRCVLLVSNESRKASDYCKSNIYWVEPILFKIILNLSKKQQCKNQNKYILNR